MVKSRDREVYGEEEWEAEADEAEEDRDGSKRGPKWGDDGEEREGSGRGRRRDPEDEESPSTELGEEKAGEEKRPPPFSSMSGVRAWVPDGEALSISGSDRSVKEDVDEVDEVARPRGERVDVI